MDIEGESAGLEKDFFRYGFMSLGAVPIETAILRASLRSSPKERMSVRSLAMLSLLKPLRKTNETSSRSR